MNEKMSPEEVSQRVVSVAGEVLSLEKPLSLEMDLRKDLEADSLDLLTLFMTLEDEFGGTIPEEDIEGINTLGGVVEYINARMAANQSEC